MNTKLTSVYWSCQTCWLSAQIISNVERAVMGFQLHTHETDLLQLSKSKRITNHFIYLLSIEYINNGVRKMSPFRRTLGQIWYQISLPRCRLQRPGKRAREYHGCYAYCLHFCQYIKRLHNWYLCIKTISLYHMMASSNGNIFRVTGPLWMESTSNR